MRSLTLTMSRGHFTIQDKYRSLKVLTRELHKNLQAVVNIVKYNGNNSGMNSKFS